jgi:putative peptide zinc metalloprotease protein
VSRPRRAGVVALALALALSWPVLSTAPVAAQDNAAVAVNTRDGSSFFKLAFSVRRVSGEVDATNAAVAFASCEACQTVAAAIQVVLVMGESTSATPENLALAVNYQCTDCETLATAYQMVYGDGRDLMFSPEGLRRLAELRRRFQQLRQRDDLTLDQLADEIGAIAGEVADVVDTELVERARASASSSSTSVPEGTTTTSDASETSSVPSTSTTRAADSSTTTTDRTETTSTTDEPVTSSSSP